ncbi:aminoglycoside phosphotransferase [Mycobacterium lentiflavum]|uniref:Aminoglycoside phosphotransferase n=1 Tax=Mycobacterium lentiflavum TaxID=141349 RepID=A0A0E4H067_MYCLN|nr:phosphotransferase [Mycobacterium lentiflavum]CQD18200.1 aminoglycoside phosphotransferase [Mycobacterium lentiflavum]
MTESGVGANVLRPRSARIVDSVDDITAAWLTDALRQGGRLDSGQVVAFSSELMSVGQLGSVARLTLAYRDAGPDVTPTVMVKWPSKDAGSRAIGVTLGVYESEVRFYQEIAPTVGIRVPAVRWADIESTTGRFTLLLEDLSEVGMPGDMIAGGSPDQAARALDALVDLQAPRWSDPALRELDWLANPTRRQNFFAGVEPALPLFLERFADRLDAEDIEFVRQVVPYAQAWAAQMTAGPTVVLHGDYRMDNILFPHDPTAKVAVFDWQAASLGPPLVDASVYLGGCLSLGDRRHYERDLLRHYHDGLVAQGVTGFSFDEVWESYRWCIFYGLMLSVPFSVQLEQTERGDALFAGMVRSYTQQARDLESMELLK